MNIEQIQGMSDCDLMHYSREQRKFIHDHYEKYCRKEGEVNLNFYIQKIYIPMGLANKFHEQYMARHRAARDYLATVSPK